MNCEFEKEAEMSSILTWLELLLQEVISNMYVFLLVY